MSRESIRLHEILATMNVKTFVTFWTTAKPKSRSDGITKEVLTKEIATCYDSHFVLTKVDTLKFRILDLSAQSSSKSFPYNKSNGFTGERCPPEWDTQATVDQSEVALEIKDTLEVGHAHTSKVDPSHVAQRHKDSFALEFPMCAYIINRSQKILRRKKKARIYFKSHQYVRQHTFHQ